MEARKLLPKEQQRAWELFSIAFESPIDRSKPFKPKQSDFWGAFRDGAMVSFLVENHYKVSFDGGEYPMAGIGAVSSLPHARRSGGIRSCFEAMLPDLYDRGFVFSYLYPFSTAFYRKFGYEACVQKYALTLDPGQLRPGEVEGQCILLEGQTGKASSIGAIDRAWEKKYNMFVLHEDSDSRWAESCDPAASGNYAYLYERQEGPGGYMEFHLENQPDGRNLVCDKFRFLDADGFRGLMTIFKSLAADHRYVKLCLPAEPAMQYLCPEWSLGAAQWSIVPAGMARVVNVQKALEGARIRGEGSLTLEVTDPQIPQNNGTYRLTYGPGRANCVERTDAPAQLSLTIPAFSALLCGAADFTEARSWMDGVQVHETAPFEELFYRKPLMIADYF